MEYVLFGIIAGIVLTVILAIWGNVGCDWWHTAASVVAFVLGSLMAVLLVFFCFLAWDWKAAEYKARILNREYDTSYTREEVFYAKDVIETIRELNRQRYEINGDLLRGKD